MSPSALAGSFCTACGDWFYPCRRVCPRCGRTVDERTVCGKGDIYSYTTIDDAATSPHIIALVHLAEGGYVTAQLVGLQPESIFIGLPVEIDNSAGALAFRPRRSLVD